MPYIRNVPPRHEGRFGRSSPERRAGCDGRVSAQTMRACAYGQAVWSCPPDAGVKRMEMIHSRRRLTSPVLRGDHGAAVKPLRRECRTCFGLTCLSCVHSPFSHTSLRVRPAPGAPCALVFSEGQRRCKARTRNRAAGMRLHVLSAVMLRESGASRIPEASRLSTAVSGHWIARSCAQLRTRSGDDTDSCLTIKSDGAVGPDDLSRRRSAGGER